MNKYILTVREITHARYHVEAVSIADAVIAFNESGPYNFYQESSKVIEDEVIAAELVEEGEDA